MSTEATNPYEPPQELVAGTAVAGDTGLVRDGETLSVKYQMGVEEYVEIGVYLVTHTENERQNYYTSWALRFLMGLVALLTGIRLMGSGKPDLVIASIAFGVLCFIYTLLHPLRYRSRLRRRMSNLLAEGRNAGMIGDWRIIFSPARLSVFTPLVESHYCWEAIERVESTPDAVYIYTGAVDAVFVPRRAFVHETEMGELVEVVRSRAGLPMAPPPAR